MARFCVSAILSAITSHIATVQPSAASWIASSRPMPVPPPVMTAILPAKSFMTRLPLAGTSVGNGTRKRQRLHAVTLRKRQNFWLNLIPISRGVFVAT